MSDEKAINRRDFLNLCIGCGVCEYHCPVGGEAAIQVQTLPNTNSFISGI
jgi:ferredoxin